MERFYSLREKELKLRGKYRGLRQTVISELAHELQEAWIFMNIYPVSIRNVKIKVEKFVTEFES